MSSMIQLDNVSLDYLVKTGSDSIKKSIINCLNRYILINNSAPDVTKNSSYRALNNITLSFNTGDRIGLLGRNGSGKSTLLRVLAKIYKPTIGSVSVQGNLSNIFDVNLGMNVEATGYENIINLSVLRGLSKKEALNQLPSIEMFTELGPFLHQPVRTYSAGMQMKLAFSVATSASSNILLIDEIIGVGDAHFMDKAKKRLETHIEKSHILVLASHSTAIIRQFCNKVIVLNKGEVQFNGDVESGIRFYEGNHV